MSKIMDKLVEGYSRFLCRNYLMLILIILFFTGLVGLQITHVHIDPMDYKNFLPSHTKTMQDMNFVEDKFMSTDSVKILIKTKRGEEIDWTDPEVVSFVDKLGENINSLSLTEYILSYPSTIRRKNNNSIKIGQGQLKSLMQGKKILKPLDPLAQASGYVHDFEELSEGLKKQHLAVEELTASSKEILDNVKEIRKGIRKLKTETNKIYKKETSVSELKDGMIEIEHGLETLSQSITELSDSTANKYCSQYVYDPLYSEFTSIPNPTYNQTMCNAYSVTTIKESYENLRDIYCYDPFFQNLTKCAVYNQTLNSGSLDDLDYSIYQGFQTAAGSIDNKLIPGINEALDGVEKAGDGLENFKHNVIEIDNSLQEALIYMRELETGLEQYYKSMCILENKTKEISERVNGFNNRISKTYEYLKNNLDSEYKKEKFKFSNKKEFSKFFSKDKRSSVIIVNIKKKMDRVYVDRKLNDVLETIDKPSSIQLSVAGDIVRFNKLQSMIPKEISKTSILAMLLIITIIIILLKRPVMSILTLSTIVFGTIWTFGILGIIRMHLTPASSGVLSMLFGIGIDFGIQLINEFNMNFFSNNKYIEASLAETMKITTKPILITTGAALIGFFVMGIGEVTIMKDMGTILMLGTPMYFLSATIVLPLLLVIYSKFFKRGETE